MISYLPSSLKLVSVMPPILLIPPAAFADMLGRFELEPLFAGAIDGKDAATCEVLADALLEMYDGVERFRGVSAARKLLEEPEERRVLIRIRPGALERYGMGPKAYHRFVIDYGDALPDMPPGMHQSGLYRRRRDAENLLQYLKATGQARDTARVVRVAIPYGSGGLPSRSATPPSYVWKAIDLEKSRRRIRSPEPSREEERIRARRLARMGP